MVAERIPMVRERVDRDWILVRGGSAGRGSAGPMGVW